MEVNRDITFLVIFPHALAGIKLKLYASTNINVHEVKKKVVYSLALQLILCFFQLVTAVLIGFHRYWHGFDCKKCVFHKNASMKY